MNFTIRPAREADLEAINRIYNHEILHGTATWDIEPWPFERRLEWFEEHKADHSQPVFVAEVEGDCAGFAYLSIYRARAGYRFTREDTVYVDPAFHRLGMGRALLGALVEAARGLEVRALLGIIEAGNVASIELHRQRGFEQVAHHHDVGHKFGRWLDSVTMELRLPFEPRN